MATAAKPIQALKFKPHGFHRNRLPIYDSFCSDRWAWWIACKMNSRVGDWQIPRIDFCSHSEHSPYEPKWRAEAPDLIQQLEANIGSRSKLAKDIRTLVQLLSPRRGNFNAVALVVNSLLFAVGDRLCTSMPSDLEPYEVQALAFAMDDLIPRFMAHPGDWAAAILCEHVYPKGSGAGWFPTPIHVCEMMTAMTFGDGDHRFKTVMEPCLGTGAMLLTASNRSLRLYGNDIDAGMVAWATLQAYFYVPWLASPTEHLAEFQDKPSTPSRARAPLQLSIFTDESEPIRALPELSA